MAKNEFVLESTPEEQRQFEVLEKALPPTAEEGGFKIESIAGQEESYLGAAGRNVAAMTKGVAKRALGYAGDVQQGVQGILGMGASALGLSSPEEAIEKMIARDPSLTPEQQEEVRAKWGQLQPGGLPTSKEIGKGIDTAAQKLFGVDPSYFKPTGEFEKILHSTTKDAASIAMSTLFGAPVGLAFGAVEALVPNLVKFGAKKLGFGKGVQRMSKLGTQLLTGAYRLFKPKAAATVSYGAANEALGEYERIAQPITQKALLLAEKKVSTGALTPKWKGVVSKHVEELKHVKISGSSLGREAVADKRSISKIINAFDTPGEAKSILGDVRKAMKADLYSHDNKKFVKALKFGDQMWKDIKNSEKIFETVKSVIKSPVTAVGSLGVLTSIVLGGIKDPSTLPAKLLSAAATGLGVVGGVKVLDLLAKSPSMYKYYGKIMAAAAANKTQQIGILVKKLDEGLTEEFGEANKKQKGA